MSGADDLRTELKNDFAQELAAFDGYEDEPSEDLSGDYLGRAEELLALLADPVRRLAVLDAMGLDVREGTLIDFKPVPYDPDPGWVVEPPGDIHEREGHHAGVSVFVVRPRGEATDA